MKKSLNLNKNQGLYFCFLKKFTDVNAKEWCINLVKCSLKSLVFLKRFMHLFGRSPRTDPGLGCQTNGFLTHFCIVKSSLDVVETSKC